MNWQRSESELQNSDSELTVNFELKMIWEWNDSELKVK
jgi:hypothetical protein